MPININWAAEWRVFIMPININWAAEWRVFTTHKNREWSRGKPRAAINLNKKAVILHTCYPIIFISAEERRSYLSACLFRNVQSYEFH